MTRYTATNLVRSIEAFIAKYVVFSEPCYTLPLALWVIGTFLFEDFDCFPYLVITADTKRAGKTRLAEMLAFCSSNPRNFGAMTPAGVFYSLEKEAPTIFFDEAEVLSSEAATTMRAVLNMGYRKGQTVPRVVKNQIKEFPTYSPKVFVLIGDVADTLKDRSIIVRMKRGEPAERFVREIVAQEGAVLHTAISEILKAGIGEKIAENFLTHGRLDFLNDRDEEIWTPLFVIAASFCERERLTELTQYAVDMATEKTQASRRYVNLQGEELKAEDDEYAKRLLRDVYAVVSQRADSLGRLGTAVLLESLYAMPTAPWRKFRGDGLTVRNLSDMLSRFGLASSCIRAGSGRRGSKVIRGYRKQDVERAHKKTFTE